MHWDRFFTVVRQVVTFALGVWVVVYAVTTSGKDLLFIFAGFALIGLVPVEDFLRGATIARKRDLPDDISTGGDKPVG